MNWISITQMIDAWLDGLEGEPRITIIPNRNLIELNVTSKDKTFTLAVNIADLDVYGTMLVGKALQKQCRLHLHKP